MESFTSVTGLVKGFERFVREDIEELAARENSWFDQAVETAKPQLVLYGLGTLGRTVLKGLRELDLQPVAIADAALSSLQSEIEGIPCLSPAAACQRFGEDGVFIVTVFNQSGEKAFARIKANLNALGAKRVVYFLPFLWKHAKAFLPYYSLDLPGKLLGQQDEILKVYNMLGDEPSKDDYASFLYHLVCPEPMISCPATDGDTYFPKNIVRLSQAEVFVDGGAFDGDTLASFVERTGGRFSSYIGIEPDPANLARLEQRVAALRPKVTGTLETRGSAIGSQSGELFFAANGTLGSAIDACGNITVPVARLGDLWKGAAPTFVKLDIEGAELDALSGAKSLLTEAKPKLAVCVYHRQNHLWKIPWLMHEINPEYHLFLRRHREYLDDVVAYAIPS